MSASSSTRMQGAAVWRFMNGEWATSAYKGTYKSSLFGEARVPRLWNFFIISSHVGAKRTGEFMAKGKITRLHTRYPSFFFFHSRVSRCALITPAHPAVSPFLEFKSLTGEQRRNGSMISFFNFFDSLNIVINLSRSTNSKLEDGLGFVICIIIIPLI